MRKKLSIYIYYIGFAILICLLFALPAHSDTLITRDDFLCHDTTIGDPSTANYPMVAIDGSGKIYETNYLPGNPTSLHQFNCFDRFGNQLQPVINFLPDTVSEDTIWNTNSLYHIQCNDPGICFIPYFAELEGTARERLFFTLFDSLGNVANEPICLSCEPEYYDFYSSLPRGDINNNGVTATVWRAWREWMDIYDSVFIRLYFLDNDSLSPIISPTTLPQPVVDDPYCGGNYLIFYEPAVGIAADGSFAAAWVARPCALSHVYYVVYNTDATPRTEIAMVDCEGDFMDTAQCVTSNVHNVNMTMESDGDFYIVWFDHMLGLPRHFARKHIWLRGYNADGTPKYDPIRVNDADSLNLFNGVLVWPQISCDDYGNVLVSWSDARLHSESNLSNSYHDVFVQKIDHEGNLVGSNYRVNNIPGIAGKNGVGYDCDMNNAGQAVIIWRNSGEYFRIVAQLMSYDDIGRFIPGDVNFDLSADIADLINMVEYMFFGEKPTFWPRDLVDMDGNGTNCDIADLVYLVEYMFFNGPVPITPDEGIRPNPGKFNPNG